MAFVIPQPEDVFDQKVKEVSTITYSTNPDTALIKNLVRIIMVPPLDIIDAANFLNAYGMVIVKIHSIADECGVWINKTNPDDIPCGNETVLFVYFTPANPNATQDQVNAAIAKIKQITGVKAG